MFSNNRSLPCKMPRKEDPVFNTQFSRNGGKLSVFVQLQFDRRVKSRHRLQMTFQMRTDHGFII